MTGCTARLNVRHSFPHVIPLVLTGRFFRLSKGLRSEWSWSQKPERVACSISGRRVGSSSCSSARWRHPLSGTAAAGGRCSIDVDGLLNAEHQGQLSER